LGAKFPSPSKLESSLAGFKVSQDEAEYILYRIAELVQGDDQELRMGKTSIEHIYPKEPNKNEWGGEAGQSTLDPFLWHVGNLTIIARGKNDDAGNKEFRLKKPIYEKSKIILTEAIAEHYKKWDEKQLWTGQRNF
jgi:hypothetical protein